MQRTSVKKPKTKRISLKQKHENSNEKIEENLFSRMTDKNAYYDYQNKLNMLYTKNKFEKTIMVRLIR